LNATNWNRTDPYQSGVNLLVPFTCCPVNGSKSWSELPTDFSAENTCATTGVNAYTQGCYDRLLHIIATYKQNFIIGVVVVGVVELLAFLFAILLYCRREEYKSV